MMTFEIRSFEHREATLRRSKRPRLYKTQTGTVELALTATRYCKLRRYPKPYLLWKDDFLAGVFQRQAAADAFTPGFS
jgi:hypothetical protein